MAKCFLVRGYASDTSMSGDTHFVAGADDHIGRDALRIPISEEVRREDKSQDLDGIGSYRARHGHDIHRRQLAHRRSWQTE